jgi:hypothetical protein
VLVYCDPDLTKAITEAGIVPTMVDVGVDHSLLRRLDKLNATGYFPVVVSESLLGMRGIDYRSESLTTTLVIAKSFENKRDAIQGFNRVGRFTDKCTRVRFLDVSIMDKKAESAQTLKMLKFVSALKQNAIVLAPVEVKKPTTSYKGKNAKRQADLLKRK